MSHQNCIALFVCIYIMLNTINSQEFDRGVVKIGDSCERDYQCIKHGFCRVQQTCLCDSFYAPSLDMATCHVTAGAPCSDNDGCGTMSNAECRQNVCTCKDNFMLDINNSSNCIIRPTKAGDLCQRVDECRESLEMAYCIDGKCTCYTDYRFVNETGTCLRKRGLYEPCRRDYECFLNEQSPNGLECRNGECACREGEASCSKGSPAFRSAFLVLVAFSGMICRTLG